MSKRTYTTEGKTLHVTGRIWQGQECAHEYSIPEGDEPPECLAEAKQIAGDFESLDSAMVVTRTRVIEETIETKELE